MPPLYHNTVQGGIILRIFENGVFGGVSLKTENGENGSERGVIARGCFFVGEELTDRALIVTHLVFCEKKHKFGQSTSDFQNLIMYLRQSIKIRR